MSNFSEEIFLWTFLQLWLNKRVWNHYIEIIILYSQLKKLIFSGFNLYFWTAVVKIYPFSNLSWVNKDENITQQSFPAQNDSIFLTVTENQFVVWNYHFSGPTAIYLSEFSNINSSIKCKIFPEFTIEAPDIIPVSLLLTETRCSSGFVSLTLNLDLNICISESDLEVLSHLRRSSL